ncbi:unnamed protein product [Withania somnifera]
MGNVNGREESEGNIPSGVDSGGFQDTMAVHQVVDGEFMGQSPPSSPRASRSPLMFRPEQTSSGYEETCDKQGVPTLITWTLDGKEVSVEGSWNNWKSRRQGKDFTILKVLPSGVYRYRFIVDGQWRCSPYYVPEDIENISGFEPPQSLDSTTTTCS